jgi:hypothetical protein
MRRRRSDRRAPHSLLFLAPLFLAARLPAQSGVATEGALDLLVPIGARAVALGQAAAADQSGSADVWWNPAGIARATKREVAFHFSQTFAGNDNALTLLYPVRTVGVFALSGRLLDLGAQSQTGPGSDTAGTLYPRSVLYALTFAAAFGAHVSAGLTYKVYQLRLDCTAGCPDTHSPSTTALDFGAQYQLGDSLPLAIGVAVRNVGLKLQVRDEAQADPLPARVDVGLAYSPRFQQLGKDASVRLSADLVNRFQLSGPGLRFGAELAWQTRLQARAGYALYGPTGSGPSVGFGFNTDKLQIDITRFFSDLASASGQSPAYLSLRYMF